MTLSALIRKGVISGLATANGPTVATVATVAVANAVEGGIPPPVRTGAVLGASWESLIRAWLDLIGEKDPDTLREVLEVCRADMEARSGFVRQAQAALQGRQAFTDDRNHCRDCSRLVMGFCQAIRNPNGKQYRPTMDVPPRRCEAFQAREGGRIAPLSAVKPSPPRPKGCGSRLNPACRHFTAPGRSSGYCRGREDLEPAYGPMHPLKRLPDDGGEACEAYAPRDVPNEL
jgi:hypothetical protein